jgi:hypothetical protein
MDMYPEDFFLTNYNHQAMSHSEKRSESILFVQHGDRRDLYVKLFLCLLNTFAPTTDQWSDSNKREHFSFKRRLYRIFCHCRHDI